MEQEACETPSAGARETANDMTDIVVVDLESYVNVELDMEKNNAFEVLGHDVSGVTQGPCHFFYHFIVEHCFVPLLEKIVLSLS